MRTTVYVPYDAAYDFMVELTKSYGGCRAFHGTGMWRVDDTFPTDEIAMIVMYPNFHPTVWFMDELLQKVMKVHDIKLVQWDDGVSVHVVRKI